MNRPTQDEAVDRRAARYELGKRAFVVALLGWMLATSSFQVYGIYQVRQTQANGSPTTQRLISILDGIAAQQDDIDSASSNSAAVLHQLQDCLQVKGKCYQQSQRRTSDFAAVLLVGVACAQGFTDLSDARRIEATNECVADWLSKHPQLFSSQ